MPFITKFIGKGLAVKVRDGGYVYYNHIGSKSIFIPEHIPESQMEDFINKKIRKITKTFFIGRIKNVRSKIQKS